MRLLQLMSMLSLLGCGSSGAGGGGPSTPVNLAPPSIDIGDGLVGTVATSAPGVWTGEDTVTQQWYSSATPIGGATGTTFELTEDTAGTVLTMRETATNVNGSIDEDSNSETTEALSAPAIVTPATIDGSNLNLGGELSILDFGTCIGNPPGATITGQNWYKDGGTPIGFANNPTYIITIDDVGDTIQVGVIWTNSQGSSSGPGSNGITANVLSSPVCLFNPVISSSGGATPTMSVDNLGVWEGNESPTLSGYQWFEEVLGTFQVIPGETSSTYVGIMAMNYRCEVTYVNSQGSNSALSNEQVG